MVFRKLGNKWVVDLNGIYTYNDVQQFDFNIYFVFFLYSYTPIYKLPKQYISFFSFLFH